MLKFKIVHVAVTVSSQLQCVFDVTLLLLSQFDATGDQARYKVPLDVNMGDTKADNPKYSIEVQDDPFSLKVIRTSTGTVL